MIDWEKVALAVALLSITTNTISVALVFVLLRSNTSTDGGAHRRD